MSTQSQIIIPNKRLELYLDESAPQNGSFFIHVGICGTTGMNREFQTQAEAIVAKHSIALGGSSFKEFKGQNLTEKNWRSISPAFREMLEAFVNMHNSAYETRSLITFEAIKLIKSNVDFLAQHIKYAITQICPEVEESKAIAISKEAQLLWWLITRKWQFSSLHKELYIFPDEKGSSIRRLQEIWGLTSSLGSVLLDDRPVVLGRLARAIEKALKKLGNQSEYLENPSPSIKKITAIKSSDCYLVQACDIVAHLYLAYLRHKAGSPKCIHQLKADMLSQYIELQEASHIQNMQWDGNEVTCTDPNLKYCIELLQ